MKAQAKWNLRLLRAAPFLVIPRWLVINPYTSTALLNKRIRAFQWMRDNGVHYVG